MKKISILIMFLFFISCTTTVVPKASELSKEEIINIGIKESDSKFGILINEQDTAITKSGYGLWKIVLYGDRNPYFVEIDENGNIKKTEKKDYIH